MLGRRDLANFLLKGMSSRIGKMQDFPTPLLGSKWLLREPLQLMLFTESEGLHRFSRPILEDLRRMLLGLFGDVA